MRAEIDKRPVDHADAVPFISVRRASPCLIDASASASATLLDRGPALPSLATAMRTAPPMRHAGRAPGTAIPAPSDLRSALDAARGRLKRTRRGRELALRATYARCG